MRFDWDATKAAVNIRKHGISFEEAVTVFADPFAIRIFDELHSSQIEESWILVGCSIRNRVLFVVYLEIELTSVRIISARKATLAERRDYEENRQQLGG